MWVGEKFQSNPEIAGSPRNSFRASPDGVSCGGRALNRLGGVKAYRSVSNSECHVKDADQGVRLHEISWAVKRERAQTAS